MANTLSSKKINSKEYKFYDLSKLDINRINKLPISIRILLENLLRFNREKMDVDAILNREENLDKQHEILFTPSRVILQDFTGVPSIVDLAVMRDAMKDLGGDPTKINPLQPVELVIDHSVQVDKYDAEALEYNTKKEYERNEERYIFLKWGQKSFSNFRVVPPETGIVHQVNLEYLARVVFEKDGYLYPDTLIGTDSHTTMINGVGVLGWGVGGIEAEAAMLGQPVSMLIPEVMGFKLIGKLPEGATATDLVLTVTEILRKKGVVGKFVEFYGDGLDNLSLADRATIANMAPEYGATSGFFPVDEKTIDYLKLTGRSNEHCKVVEEYCKANMLWRDASTQDQIIYNDSMTLDLSKVVPSIAGPKRPQDRIDLTKAKENFIAALSSEKQEVPQDNNKLQNGSVVIAAITSCTNTSNPQVLVAAGLVARKAAEKGLQVPEWVKTSLAPGSKVVTDYLHKTGLLEDLEKLGFYLVGYGCTTCIGNSGPLKPEISKVINENNLYVTSVLSGNRNFEGRVHPEVRMNYLASPPLVVAYALAGTMNIDFYNDPIGHDKNNIPVFLKDLWPTSHEIQEIVSSSINSNMFVKNYESVFDGGKYWKALSSPEGDLYKWDKNSTYVRKPTFFDGMTDKLEEIKDLVGARALAVLGDSVTTDHISPAGSIKADSPAGKYLQEHGVKPIDFNSYGSRRGNHEVMVRGTFANIRLRNKMVPGVEGGFTKFQPDGTQMTIFEAAEKYQANKTPLIILAGKEYGSGSSRDWAAKGPYLLGIKVVIAQSYERIHRSNLIGMGILPLQFKDGESAESFGLTGDELFDISGINAGDADKVTVSVTMKDNKKIEFAVDIRLDTPQEVAYYKNGGILKYVLRQLATQ